MAGEEHCGSRESRGTVCDSLQDYRDNDCSPRTQQLQRRPSCCLCYGLGVSLSLEILIPSKCLSLVF